MTNESALTDELRALMDRHGSDAFFRAARDIAGTSSGNEENARGDADGFSGDDADEQEDDDDDEPDDEEDDEVASDDDEPPRPPAPRRKTKPGASMKKRNDIVIPENVTHWRCYRLVDGSPKGERLYWGPAGVIFPQWPVQELSYDTIRGRWGAGKYAVYWYGPLEGDTRKMGPRGGGIRIHLVEVPGTGTLPPEPMKDTGAREAAPSITPAAWSSSPASPAPDGTRELLAALAAMRPNQGGSGGTDLLATIVPILSFMSEQQNKQARLAEERFNAERAVMMERERLASKERIAQMEANAQAHVRGARGFDPTALVEQFRVTMQETIESVMEAHGEAAASGPSEMIQLVTMLRDALAPAVQAFTAKVMSDANGLPGPYKSVGT